MLRRQFTKFLVLTSFGMLAGNAWIWARSLFGREAADLPHVLIARASELPTGAVRLFNYPGQNDPCILLRRADGSLAAFSQKCTHLSCAVYYSVDRDRLECPCHEGYFSADSGRVIQGPPPRPLPQVLLEQRGDDVIAVGMTVSQE